MITDSAASLPPAAAASAGVTVVPLGLTIGGEPYRDGEVTMDELVGRLDEGVTTSSPAPGDFADAISARMAEGVDGVVVVTVAASMSATYAAACVAARPLGARALVVDSTSACGAEGLVALAAARQALSGGGLDDVAAEARRAAASVRLVAAIPDVARLVASGRAPALAGWLGSRLRLHPIIEFAGGRVRPRWPTRSTEASVARLLDAWRASRPPGGVSHVAVMHALAPDAAAALEASVKAEVEASVKAEVEAETLFVCPFTPAMVSQVGGGLVGLAWWWERDGA